MTLDDVWKREDAVKDVAALVDHIKENMRDELDAERIVVMGGSCECLTPSCRIC